MKCFALVLTLLCSVFAVEEKITVTAPPGDVSYFPGQNVLIKWKKTASITNVNVQYSINNGSTWTAIGTSKGDSIPWTTPALKRTTHQSFIKVTSVPETDLPSVSDISDTAFSIDSVPIDAYEPNNDTASAKTVPLGDSVVKNATVMGAGDSLDTDTSTFDVDYFKTPTLEGNPAMTAVVNAFYWNGLGSTVGNTPPRITVYAPYHQVVASGTSPLAFEAPKWGVYICKVTSTRGSWSNYGLSIKYDTLRVGLVAPNGGETFTAGQKVQIRWTRDRLIPAVSLFYRIKKGGTWEPVVQTDSATYIWTVPHLKHGADSALFKVVAKNARYPFSDESNGTFTIQQSPPDAYEPNDDFASAASIGIGDSVVKNATVIGGRDTLGADTTNIDVDYFKVALTGGKMTSITAIPGFLENKEYLYSFGAIAPTLRFCDSSKNTIASGTGTIVAAIPQTATYYCIVSSPNKAWSKYGLSIHEISVLSCQKSLIDTASLKKTSDSAAGATYAMQLNADTTKVSIDIILNAKVQGSVTTMVLSPNDFALPPGTKADIKAISITTDSAFASSLKKADIAIPYSASDLKGYSEKLLTVLWLNETNNQWVSVPFTIDTIKNIIVAHTTHFSIYGVFIASSITAVGPEAANALPVFGLRASYLSPKQSIVAHVTLPKSVHAELRLYDLQGKCVRKCATIAGGQANATLMWNIGALSNGKYFLCIKAGTSTINESVLIIN